MRTCKAYYGRWVGKKLIPAYVKSALNQVSFPIITGVPLKPMLAKICEGIPDALRQLKGDFLAEFKYDGQRSQIHLLPDGSVKLFSRNCKLLSERGGEL